MASGVASGVATMPALKLYSGTSGSPTDLTCLLSRTDRTNCHQMRRQQEWVWPLNLRRRTFWVALDGWYQPSRDKT